MTALRRLQILVVALPLALAWPAAGQQGELRFRDIEWGSAAEDVRQVLTSNGWTFNGVDGEGDYEFSGEFYGEDAAAWVYLDSSGCFVALDVQLLTPDERARSRYADAKARLVEQYGPPDSDMTLFEAPFWDGDGNEDEAIRQGKGSFGALWSRNSGMDSATSLAVMLADELSVSISWESPSFEAELERRESVVDRQDDRLQSVDDMRLDLYDFALAQETYFTDYERYGTFSQVSQAGLFVAHSGVEIVVSDNGDTGFNATATHDDVVDVACGVVVGDAPEPHPWVEYTDTVVCWKRL